MWEDTEAKDAAITHWCEEVSTQDRSGGLWRYVRVNQTLFDSGSSWNSFGELAAASLPATEADTEDTLPIAESLPPSEPFAQQIEQSPAPETAEEPGEEGPPPDLRAAAAALHACLPDGESVPSQRLLEKAALRLGYRSSSRKVRRALGQALAAEQRARRVRFDPERKLAWRPKKKKR